MIFIVLMLTICGFTQGDEMPNATGLMASLGRGTDSEVAHVTPGEMVIPREIIDNQPNLMSAIIKAFNGYGESMGSPMDWRQFVVSASEASVNPETGAQEFKVSRGGGQGVGSGAADRDGADNGVDIGGAFGADAFAHGPTAPAVGQARAGAFGSGFSFDAGGAVRSPGGGGSQSSATPDYSPTARLESLFNSIFGDESFSVENAATLGALIEPTGLFGLANFARDMGVPSTPANPEIGNAPGGKEPQIRNGRVQAPQQAASPISFSRPSPVTLPGGLGLSGSMNNLQQRAAIATGGTQGSGIYRSQEAQDYYKNLLQRSLIGDNGELGEFGQVLPIEDQYLRSILGASYQPNTSSLLAAIANT